MPDAIVLLKNDHREVEKLFKQFEKLGDKAYVTKRKVVDEIIEQLAIHAVIEEQQFYPAVREKTDGIEDDVLEGLEEHHIVKWTLSELKDMDPQEERFDAKVRVLIESVRHHVEEEESDMFPAVRKVMGRKELGELGEALEQARTKAPVEPHPKAPDTPPANLVVTPPAAIADKGKRGLKRVLGLDKSA